jgi:transposase
MNRMRLTPGQRRRLRRQLRETSDARIYRRTLAVLDYNRGRSVKDLAASLGVTPRSIYSWLEAYARGGDLNALRDAPRSGRPRVWSPQQERVLLALLQTSPDQLGYFAVNWTVPLLQEQIARETGVCLSEDTLRRLLHRQRYVWKRFRYGLDPDPETEKKNAL